MDPFAQSLTRSPELFPYTFDARSDAVAFIRLGLAEYREASFLDERVVDAGAFRRTIPWIEVERAVQLGGLPERCDYIFHIGHVGSTLLSRLMGHQAGVFALREPGILRTLSQSSSGPFASPNSTADGFERRLSTFLRLWSRTFVPADRAVIKATSFVSDLAPALLARPSMPRAILMFVSPESYLATILGGENAPMEAKALAPSRWARLQRRLGRAIDRPEKLGMGEIVAMSWACEMTALMTTQEAAGDRVWLLNFDTFLSRPHDKLADAFRHFDVAASNTDIEAILSGPDMRRYSKAPEYAYDANLRRQVLNQARATSGAEIERGLSWLARMAKEHSAVEAALNAAG